MELLMERSANRDFSLYKIVYTEAVISFCHIDRKMQQTWDYLTQKNPASGFMQSFFWSEFKQRIGWDTFKVGIQEKGQLVGGAVVMKFHFSPTKNFLYIPEGPVLDYENPHSESLFHRLMSEIDTIADLEGKQLTTHLRIEPRLFTVPAYFERFSKAPYNLEPRNTRMIDLRMSEKDLLSDMKPKGRYNIKIAERENVQILVTEPSTSNVKSFMKIYKETTARNTFEGKDTAYFKLLFEHLKNTNNGKLFAAYYKDELLAAALIVLHGDRATYFFGASSNSKRNKMAPYKLHWEIINHLKKNGYRWYDFWGVTPKDAPPSHGWHGLSRFKEKFGGQVFNFIGAYDFVYNKKLYMEFLKESKEME